MSYNLTEDALKEALIRVDYYEMQALPTEEQVQHTFSLGFERKMRKLIRQSKKHKPTGLSLRKRTIALVAALTVLLSVTALAVPTIRERIADFAAEVYQTFTHIFWEDTGEEPQSQVQSTVFTAVKPTYIPEGFELEEDVQSGDILFQNYILEDKYIFYQQSWLEEMSTQLDTEGVKPEEFKWKGYSALYLSKQGIQTIIWHDDVYSYRIESTLNRETILRIAESVVENAKK